MLFQVLRIKQMGLAHVFCHIFQDLRSCDSLRIGLAWFRALPLALLGLEADKQILVFGCHQADPGIRPVVYRTC